MPRVGLTLRISVGHAVVSRGRRSAPWNGNPKMLVQFHLSIAGLFPSHARESPVHQKGTGQEQTCRADIWPKASVRKGALRCGFSRFCERKNKRKIDIKTDRRTDRQTDRQTQRQTQRQRQSQTNKQANRQKEKTMKKRQKERTTERKK